MENNLTALFDSLFSLLDSEVAIYREMEGLLRNEKKALILSSVPVLSQSNRLKEDMLNQAAVLERSRMDLVRQIAGHLRVSPEIINLSYLITYVQPPQRDMLRRFQAELKEMAGRIKALNRENQRLAEMSLVYAKSWLNYFVQITSPQSGYVSNGQLQMGQINGKLINRRS